MDGFVANVIITMFQVYLFLLFGTILINWIPEFGQTKIGAVIMGLTRPYFGLFRSWIRPVPLGAIQLDLSSVVALIVFFFIQEVVRSVVDLLIRGLTT